VRGILLNSNILMISYHFWRQNGYYQASRRTGQRLALFRAAHFGLMFPRSLSWRNKLRARQGYWRIPWRLSQSQWMSRLMDRWRHHLMEVQLSGNWTDSWTFILGAHAASEDAVASVVFLRTAVWSVCFSIEK